MLKDRIRTAIVLILAFLAAVFLLPPLGVLVILLFLCGVALLEFYSLLDASQIPHFKIFGLVGGLAIVASTWFSWSRPSGCRGDIEGIFLFLFLAAIFVRQFFRKVNPRPWETIAGTILGVMYVAFLISFFAKLFLAWNNVGRLLILYLITVVKVMDAGAYFVGCAHGRHKLIPRISPAKSWEGLGGGVAAGTLASLLYFWIFHGPLSSIHMNGWDAVVLGVLLSVIGTVGDLTESLFKRAAGVKDSGTYLLGMGGLLDVLDSVLFAAPTLYIYARLFF